MRYSVLFSAVDPVEGRHHVILPDIRFCDINSLWYRTEPAGASV